ncbi:meiosis-specific kinetochore protein [Dromiciops gliroides]|uniref:meiosis-specific kinetochore protein n=1 Tax=Dromiciops gliroides TaxID=33562 RepID=UPI001CC3ED54|nr:meiosis-specific kinetochore protein [Dromiciops gliroides]
MWPKRSYVRRPRGRLNHTPPPPGPSCSLPEPQSRYGRVAGRSTRTLGGKRPPPFSAWQQAGPSRERPGAMSRNPREGRRPVEEGGSYSAWPSCGPCYCHASPGPKGKLQMKILPKLKENVETTQLHESPTTKHSMQLNVAHQKKLQKSEINEDSKNTNTFALKESMTDDDLQGESNAINTQISSGITSSSDISFSLLRSSDIDFCIETTSFEDSLSSFPSPEIFRGGEFSDINDSTTESHLKFKNSTFRDTSRAVAIENMHQFSNLSAILDTSICKILPETEKTPDWKTKQTSSSVPVGKKNRRFLTSSPSSETSRFEINLSPVQKLSSEGELNPNTSNYVYSDEIVPASSSEEEKDSWESQCIASEMCCIIKSSPRNQCTEMPYCCPKGVSTDVINEPVDKERLKSKDRMNTIERIDTQWREEQTNSSVTIREKNVELLGSSPSTDTGRFEAPCLVSEICCIVKTSPNVRCSSMPDCPHKGILKDMVKKQEDKEELKTKGRVDTTEGTSNQWREKVMESKPQVQRVVTAKHSCITSDMCCIVKASPRIRCMKMPCCPPKRVSKDIIMTDGCDG